MEKQKEILEGNSVGLSSSIVVYIKNVRKNGTSDKEMQ